MRVYEFIWYFFAYGILGWCVEVMYATVVQKTFVNRGFLNGPICPIYGVGVAVVLLFLEPLRTNLLLLYIVGTVLVTVIEGITGYVLDKLFHHKWWDYSNRPFNIGGYVCLLFSLIWGVALVAIVLLIHPVIQKGVQLIPTTVGLVLLVLLTGALLADLYVTVAGILKLNKKLEAMEKIAAELKVLSNKVGESLSENVLDTLEVQKEGKKRLEDVQAEGRKKLEEMQLEGRKKLEDAQAELRKRYQEMMDYRSKVGNRLLKAFPKMQSREHQSMLNELKEYARNRKWHR
ncbi:putative ABC transporter permease [Suipraeoptans intestinalis]|uniref:Uncharacterized protein n=1 Tax=Suipraeoptans intestinalis TaxID=2606628 RepID=A0A6N7UZ74_9FIRM|nr:hypothetical protein [Suipraeoptans intestinalis]MDD7770490.1 hypothetical protein [Suipraeoptans intestinalis]MDY3122337.1 hypothetical protein [Suipraeoptans intestinalis]MSR93197.1 hypothetical protein [Suipraeoptans intestinalis]